ncbi:TPA: dihydrofolate reductase family protein, partial [Streptococcus suis]
NIAMSLDGYIVRTDGSYDWIQGHGTTDYDTSLQFDNEDFFKSYDTVIMGRKSLEDCPLEMIAGYEEKEFIIASRHQQLSYDNVRFVSNIVDVIKKLKGEDGSDIWLFGGAQLVQICLKERLIDHFIIGIIPTILGNGLRLFDFLAEEQTLTLVESTVTDGIAMLRYDVRDK